LISGKFYLILQFQLKISLESQQNHCYHHLSDRYTEWIKFVFGRGSARTTLGELAALLQTFSRTGRRDPSLFPNRYSWRLRALIYRPP